MEGKSARRKKNNFFDQKSNKYGNKLNMSARLTNTSKTHILKGLFYGKSETRSNRTNFFRNAQYFIQAYCVKIFCDGQGRSQEGGRETLS